jgi:dGTPase
VAAIADDIAYNSHDIDDGLRAGLLRLEALADVPLAGRFVDVRAGGDTQRVIYNVTRRMITALVDDVVRETRGRLAALPEQSLEGVRAAGQPVVAASMEMAAELEGLKDYLYANVYRHPRVMRVMADAERIVRDLFERYMADPGALPEQWRPDGADETARAGVVADFVAGMTDRFALREHRRLFDATPELR